MSLTLPTAYRAAWVFPVAGPPVRDGIIEIDADGRIATIRSGRDRDAIDLGEVAVVPALVNAHVHLEFSDLSAPIGPATPFPQWVKNVVAHRRQRNEPVATILRRGMAEASRTGTVAVGEIATSDIADAYASNRIDVTVFRELIGPLPEHWPALLDAAELHLARSELEIGRRAVGVSPPSRSRETFGILGGLTPRRSPDLPHTGLSPHAPFTVPQELFERSVELAARYDAPVAVHLAETAAERELLASGTGELVEMMRSLGLWRPERHPPGRRPLDWLRILAKAPRALVVHGNYLDDEELDFLAEHPNLHLVYCPRTHDYFGHPPHPFRRLIERGGRVALGTDGRSSNPDLDLWREAMFLRERHADLPSATILDLVTRRGAEALGVAGRHGVLATGRRADFLVVRLAEPHPTEPPDLFAAGNAVIRTLRGGIEPDCHDGGHVCRD